MSKGQLLDIKHSEDEIWGNYQMRKRKLLLIIRKKNIKPSFRMKVEAGN